MEEIVGSIERLVFSHEQNGFSVFIVKISNKESITATGTIPTLQAGQRVCLQGTWSLHPKFGKQFQVTTCSLSLPTSLDGLKKYLGSGLIKGIGKVYAEKLVNHFKADVLTVIDKTPHALKEVPGIGEKRIELIIQAWKDQREIASIMVFLQDKGASSAFAAKIYKQYGTSSIAKVTENPYCLAQDMWGIGFKTADTIAQKLDFEKHSLKRICAGILFALTQHTQNGHLYAEVDELKQLAVSLLELDSSEQTALLLKQALHMLYEQKKIQLISKESHHYVALSQHYYVEKAVSSTILSRLNEPSALSFDLQKIYHSLRTPHANKLELNEAQQKGILTCLQSKITIITGGPGTGKTTLIKTLLDILDEQSIQYRLTAPTGRAAKRMSESTGRFSVTLHRLLEFNPQTMSFTHNETNALKLQFLIVDEASMIDIFLAYSLLKAVPYQAHIVFIGDIDQLPSVGAGNFLNDLIASKKIPTLSLSFIFRQAHNSLITLNAHRINAGEFPLSSAPQAHKDFFFIKEENTENVPAHLHSFFQTTLQKYHLSPENSIVLSPMNRGNVGTVALNQFLQSIINPHAKEHPSVSRLGTNFTLKDRVMQMRNNYDKNVFNGDIGTIENINQDEQKLSIRFNTVMHEYDFMELDELTLAYSISIHKSQGSEFDAVVIPLFTQHYTLLQRNLIYTALTRAKKLCIIIGQPRALAMAIKNNKCTQRTTFLTDYLTSDLSCRH